MELTARRLNRASLARQLLLDRAPLPVPEAVGAVVAVQAQEPASPYLALWNRVAGFDPADLDAAFATGAVVKATLLRMTLHAVTAADHPLMYDGMLTLLRGSRFADARFTDTGLTEAEAEAALADVLTYLTEPRTNPEIQAFLDAKLGEGSGKWAWWALRSYGMVRHAPTGGPWSFGPRPAYVATGTEPGDREAGTRHLVRRYLAGFGPASVADVARCSLLRRGTVKAALGDDLVRHSGPGGVELWDVPGGALPDEDVPAPPRLLGMWDSLLLAYADRGRVLPDDLRPLVIRSNGDVLPTLLVDGHVAGVWRPVEGGIEATAFRPLPDGAWAGLAAEAAALVAFLADRDPEVYRRYRHWWAKLPPGDTRVI
jgi:hypothetical protein